MTKDELQLRWDELLIQCRFFHMDMKLKGLEEAFKLNYGETPQAYGLLRAPLEKYSWVKMTVLSFMCTHLPKIADYCWKHTKADYDKVLAAVNKSNHNTKTLATDHFATGVDNRDLIQTKRASKKAKQVRAYMAVNWDNQKASNQWRVCK